MAIAYVCLSDLHFGARTSILTNLAGERDPAAREPFAVDPTRPSLVLEGVVDGLRQRIDAAGGGTPRLVLLGDLLELALAQDDVAIEAFSRFVELVFPASGPPLFQPELWFVPGNHDHHLWEGAREGQYASYLQGLKPTEAPKAPWHVTRLFTERDPDVVYSTLLGVVVNRAAPGRNLSVRVVYPNLGLESSDGSRAVLLHHGHFTEGIYTLMSTLRSIIFPTRDAPAEVWEVEADNFAWIDFFWSTLGRSGGVGDDIGLIYEMLQDPTAVEALVLGIFERVPLPRRIRWVRAGPLGWGERRGLQAAVRHFAQPERFRAEQALSDASRQRLLAYLGGPLLSQLQRERTPEKGGPTGVPGDVTFVFGHTHKPFIDTVTVAGYAAPVRVVNDGGWVIDSTNAQPMHGGAVVMIDDDLTVHAWNVFGAGADPTAGDADWRRALAAGEALRRQALTSEIAAGKRAAGPGARR
jgi:hypothetical protein